MRLNLNRWYLLGKRIFTIASVTNEIAKTKINCKSRGSNKRHFCKTTSRRLWLHHHYWQVKREQQRQQKVEASISAGYPCIKGLNNINASHKATSLSVPRSKRIKRKKWMKIKTYLTHWIKSTITIYKAISQPLMLSKIKNQSRESWNTCRSGVITKILTVTWLSMTLKRCWHKRRILI